MAPVEPRREPSSPVTLVAAALFVLAVAALDYATGVGLAVFPLYFLPIVAVSLRLGLGVGLAGATLCAIAWVLANVLAEPVVSLPRLAAANGLVMLVAFGSVAFLAAAQRRWLERERALSRRDSLTGLLNGPGFYEAATTEIARSARYRHPVTLAYLGLDNLREVNERLGHARGDAVLVTVARTLRRASRSSDLLGRLGGDEFALLFPETGRDAAEAALRKLQARLLETMDKQGWPVTASIGAASFARPPRDAEELVHQANAVMAAVKAEGKNALRCAEAREPGP